MGRIRVRYIIIAAALAGLTGWAGAESHETRAAPAAQLPACVPAPTSRIDLGDGVKMEFVLISPGSFAMGSPTEVGDGDEYPLHQVTITEPFYLGKYEVTQEQWIQMMTANPSHFKGSKLPVDSVSWNDCQRFLQKLAAKTGHTFLLPTEAQWEYACRAGSADRWTFGDQPAHLGEYAWFEGNAEGRTHPVGQKKANAWGIHDLHGNLSEWCADWYVNPYPPGDATNPRGPAQGDARIIRGGAWGDDAINVRSAYRSANGPDGANDGVGFRCVMAVEKPLHP